LIHCKDGFTEDGSGDFERYSLRVCWTECAPRCRWAASWSLQF
jgi:hypothetical protein